MRGEVFKRLAGASELALPVGIFAVVTIVFGSLTPGKRADLVLFDGDPFEHTTHVERVLVDGRTAYRR